MTLIEFSNLIGQNVRCEWIPGQRRWHCSFHYGEVKDDAILTSVYGVGKTPLEAIGDYVDQISGELMVFWAGSPDLRCQYDVPDLAKGMDYEITG